MGATTSDQIISDLFNDQSQIKLKPSLHVRVKRTIAIRLIPYKS